MYSKTAALACARVRNWASWTRSVLSEAKKLSMGALSKQLPRRLMDGWIPCRSSTARYGPEARWADSTGRCNASLNGSEHGVEGLGRRRPPERLARSAVEGRGHCREVICAVGAQVCPLREVRAQQTVGVLVRPALPGGVRVAEVDLQARVDPQPRVLAHLRPLIPGQRLPQLLGHRRDRARDRVADRLGAMPGEGWPVRLARPVAVALHRREVPQHREPGRALDEGADRRTPEPKDEIPLPVPRNRAVLCLRRALADHHLRSDKGLALAAPGRACTPEAPSGPGRSGGRRSARGAAPRGPGRRAPGRWPRG